MKKIFSLFAAVLMAVSVMGYTLPSSTMDLKTITAANMGKWAVAKAYYLEDDYLLVSSLEAAKSANADATKGQTWITQTSGTNNGNSAVTTNWTAQSPFKGVTAYTTQAYQTLRADRFVTFRVSNCKSVSVLGKNNSSGQITVSAYLITDGVAESSPSVTAAPTGTNVQTWDLDLIDDKEYVIDITATGSSNSQVYEIAFERNVVADTRLEPELRLSATEFTAHVGDATFAEPTVYSDGGYTGSYNYSSDKPAIASVNATTGEVTIGIAGKATITVAVPQGDETYKPRSISYTITVLKVAPVGATFYESFDNFDGQGGNDGIWSGITVTPALGTFDNEGWTTEGTNYSGKECVSIRKNSNTSLPSGLTTPAIGVAGKGHVQFDAESWGSDGSNFFVDIVGGGTWVADENLDAGNISNDGTTAKVAMAKTGNWTTFDLQFEGLTATSKLRFYAPANKRAFLDEVAVFVTKTYTVNFSNSWASFCAAEKVAIPEAVVAYKGAVNGEVLTLTPVEGNVIPANVGVMLKSTEASATLTVSEEAAADFAGNELLGTTEVTAAPANAYCYSKSQNAFAPVAVDFSIPANKAYLVLASAPERISIVEADHNFVTELVNVESKVEVKKMVVNGKMMILRDGKTFDVMGRIVK